MNSFAPDASLSIGQRIVIPIGRENPVSLYAAKDYPASVAEYRRRNLVPAQPKQNRPAKGTAYQYKHLTIEG